MEGHKLIALTLEEKEGLDNQQRADLLNKNIHNALVGKHLYKGEIFSLFQFGGSDSARVFERYTRDVYLSG